MRPAQKKLKAANLSGEFGPKYSNISNQLLVKLVQQGLSFKSVHNFYINIIFLCYEARNLQKIKIIEQLQRR